jgi:uracil-DNA glycosylase family 4
MKPEHQRVLRALPASRGEVAAATGLPPRRVTAALHAVRKKGWADLDGDARWVVTADGRNELEVQGPKRDWLAGAECGECPLRVRCTPVPGTFPEVSGRRVLLVGEAPAREEERQGRPFVGRSGELLDRVLDEVRLDRGRMALTNAVACVLPRRREDEEGSKGPPAAALRACRNRLAAEVDAWRPDLIVALGAAAVRTLAGHSGMTQLHGVLLDGAGPFEGRRVLCSYHPAAVLRNERLYATLRDDIGRVRTADVRVGPPPVRVDIVQRPELPPGVPVAVDIETDGLGVGAPLVSVAFAPDPERAQVVLRPDPATFDIPNPLVFHNGMFDVERLRHRGWDCSVGEDTLLLAHAADERGDHRLEYLAAVHLGAGSYKGIAKGGSGAGKYQPSGLPDRELAQLNGMDAAYTLRLVEPLRRLVDAEGTGRAYRLMLESTEPLLDMQKNGMLLDPAVLERARGEYEAELERVHGEFRMLADALGAGVPLWRSQRDPYNFHASAAMIALFKGLGLIRSSTGRKVLDGVVARGGAEGELARRLIACRHLSKLLVSYVARLPQMAGADGRVRTVYNIGGTATGRLSSGNIQMGLPNMQNIEKGLRGAFVAPPGFVLVNVDLSQAEIRTLAHYARDPELNARLAAGADTHRAMASIVWGIPVEQVTDRQRQAAKQLNFGILYGRGEEAVAAELGVGTMEARGIIDTYYRRLPAVRPWKEGVEEKALRDGYVTYSLGRRRHFAGLAEDKVRREAVNSVIQGTASDILLQAQAEIWRALRGNPDVRLVATVHDSIVFECRAGMADMVGAFASSVMADVPRRVFGMEVPFRADVTVGERWS